MTAPIDPARLAAMVAVLLAAVTAVTLAAAHRGSSDTPAAAEADRAAATQASTHDSRDLAARPASTGDPTRGADDRPSSTRERADAEAVAAGFVEQWATVAHNEPPDDAVGRIRPYVTDALADQLLADLRQPGRSGPSQLEEVTEAVVEHIHGHDGTGTSTGTQMTLVVVARQRTRTIEGDTVEHPSFTVGLIRVGSRWRVHELVH